MFYYGPLHMDTPELTYQQGLKFITSVWTLGAVIRTYKDCWLIELETRERERERERIKEIHDTRTTRWCAVYWPSTRSNMQFQRRGSRIFHWRGRTWLTIGNRVKIPRYTHRLMHRKRVTCELHDSYFRLMTIKHAIPRTAEVMHPDGQSLGDIEWAIELLYNSVKTGSQLVWRPDPLVTRCGRESQHPAEWALRPPIESLKTRSVGDKMW